MKRLLKALFAVLFAASAIAQSPPSPNSSAPSGVMLIDPSNGVPYSPAGIVPVSTSVLPVPNITAPISVELIDPATGNPYKSSGGGPPGGTSGQIQYNNAGSFGGLTNAQVASNISPTLAVYLPTTPITTASITAAEAAACAAGGGIVKIPVGTFTMTGSLPLCNGVYYQGTGWGYGLIQTGPTSNGTILVGNGTFDAFAYNSTNLSASPPSSRTAFLATSLFGGGISQITLNNFAYGVHIGDYYNMGPQGFLLQDVTVNNCTKWGVWIENFEFVNADRVLVSGCTVGHIGFSNSSNGLQNSGDSNLGYIYASPTSKTQANIVFQQRGAGNDSLNDIRVGYWGISSGSNNAVTQTATSNGTASIAVSDTTQFAPGMPVVFTVALPGLNASGTASTVNSANTVYYITRIIDATHLAIGTSVQDPFQTLTELTPATGSGTIATWGMPLVTYQATGTGGGRIQPMSIGHLGIEGSSTVTMLLQGVLEMNIDAADVLTGGIGQWYRSASYRFSSNVDIRGWGSGASPFTSDYDNASNGNRVAAARPSNYSGPVTGTANSPQGLSQLSSDPSGRLLVNPASFALFLQGTAPDIALNKVGAVEFPNFPLASAAISVGDGGNINLWGWNTRTNHVVYTGAGGAGATLNTIPANADGVWVWLVNSTGNNFVVNSDGTQKIYNSGEFGGNGATSFTIPPYGSALLMSSYNYGGTGTTTNYFWSRIGGQQTYSSLSYQPGLITSIVNTKSVYSKVTKASTVDNIEGSAQSLTTCTTNPTITLYECGTSATCASPTTIGSVTITGTGQAFDGTVSAGAVTAGDYVAWAISAGACASLDIGATAQIHTN